MKKLYFGLLLIAASTFTGCINIIEEIFLNKDGSGTYTITMDASGIMEGGGFRQMLQMAGEQGGEDTQMPELDGPLEMDTVMYFKDAPQDMVKSFSHPELLPRISIHQVISEEKETMKTEFILDFEKVSEIDMFLKDLNKLSGQGQEMAALGGMMDGMIGGKTLNNQPLFVQSKKMLSRAKMESPEKADQEEDPNMAMVKMMMADATYKMIYHLPGKVKGTNIPNARVEGKDVFVEVSLLDNMEGKADMSGFIKHKRN